MSDSRTPRQPRVPIALEVASDELSWAPELCNLGYDVVRGDLDALHASGGVYSTSTVECVADDHPSTTLPYTASPGPGAASWFLVRRVVTSGHGTYNGGGPGQQGDRDAGIALSGADCP
jgi:hypothetical protein